MTQETHPIVDLTNEDLDAMLKRAFRKTLILGVIASIAVLIGGGWRSAAMLLDRHADFGGQHPGVAAAGPRDQRQAGQAEDPRQRRRRGAFLCARLTVFAGVIYGSLKCFHGSVTALLCGLCLAVLAIGWEALRLLRD